MKHISLVLLSLLSTHAARTSSQDPADFPETRTSSRHAHFQPETIDTTAVQVKLLILTRSLINAYPEQQFNTITNEYQNILIYLKSNTMDSIISIIKGYPKSRIFQTAQLVQAALEKSSSPEENKIKESINTLLQCENDIPDRIVEQVSDILINPIPFLPKYENKLPVPKTQNNLKQERFVIAPFIPHTREARNQKKSPIDTLFETHQSTCRQEQIRPYVLSPIEKYLLDTANEHKKTTDAEIATQNRIFKQTTAQNKPVLHIRIQPLHQK